MAVPAVFAQALLLRDNGFEIDPAVQPVLADQAFAANDAIRLAVLASAGNLIDEVEARIAACDMDAVRANWIASPVRTDDELRAVFAQGCTQGVLASLADRKGLRDLVYEEVLAAGDKRVLTRFINGGASTDLRAAAVAEAVAGWEEMSAVDRQDLQRVVLGHLWEPAIAVEAMRVSRDPTWLAEGLGRVTGSAVEVVTEVLVESIEGAERPEVLRSLLDTVSGAVASVAFTAPQWCRVTDALSAATVRLAELIDRHDPLLVERLDRLDGLADKFAEADRITALFDAGEYDVGAENLHAFCSVGGAPRSVSHGLAGDLLRTHVLPDGPLDVVLSAVPQQVGVAAKATDPSDHRRIAMIACHTDSGEYAADILSGAKDRSAAFELWARRQGDAQMVLDAIVAIEGCLDGQALLAAPAELLFRHHMVHSAAEMRRAAENSERLIAAIVDRIGVDPRRWELLLELSVGSTEPLAGLCEQVCLALDRQ